MAGIQNLKRLCDELRRRAAAASKEDEVACAVGYTASYALPVHERRQMRWRGLPRDRSVRAEGPNTPNRIVYTGYNRRKGALTKGLFWGPNGRAGFLLDVMREEIDVIRNRVVTGLRKGLSMARSLLIGGLYLQRVSQQNVPVLSGNLRASAFTRLEQ